MRESADVVTAEAGRRRLAMDLRRLRASTGRTTWRHPGKLLDCVDEVDRFPSRVTPVSPGFPDRNDRSVAFFDR